MRYEFKFPSARLRCNLFLVYTRSGYKIIQLKRTRKFSVNEQA